MEENRFNINNIDKSKWVKYRFDKIAHSISERIDPTNTELDVYIGLEHLDPETVHIKRKGCREDVKGQKLRCYPGDIIFGKRRAYQRKAGIAKEDCFCSAHAMVLRANPEVIIPELLPFFIHSDLFMHRAIDISVGSLSPTINWTSLKNQEFLLPPKDQQKKIAELLWAIDEVIEKEISLLKKLSHLKDCLYNKFLKNTDTCSKLKLKDIMTFNYGRALKEKDRINGKYQVVSSSGIQGTHNQFICEGPGIVVGRKGNVGSVTWVNNNYWVIDTAYYISVNQKYDHIPLKFFYYLLKAVNLKKYSISTAVPGLNRDDALCLNVYLPNMIVINEYLNHFETIYESISKMENKINSSKSLQKSLINQVF